MTAYDAYRTAQHLPSKGHTTADAVTAADTAGAQRPDTANDRHTIRLALDTITT